MLPRSSFATPQDWSEILNLAFYFFKEHSASHIESFNYSDALISFSALRACTHGKIWAFSLLDDILSSLLLSQKAFRVKISPTQVLRYTEPGAGLSQWRALTYRPSFPITRPSSRASKMAIRWASQLGSVSYTRNECGPWGLEILQL